MTDDYNRNPLLFPTRESKRTELQCPKCTKSNFTGRNIQGAITFTCHSCGNRWQGGLPQTMQDPREPHPNYPAAHPTYDRNPKTKEVIEVRKPVSPIQEFRGGLPITDGGEEL